MVDNPAEYISSLRAEIRDLRAALEQERGARAALESEVSQYRIATSRMAADAAATAHTAIGRLERTTAIADAAEAWFEESARDESTVDTIHRSFLKLDALVKAYVAEKEARS